MKVYLGYCFLSLAKRHMIFGLTRTQGQGQMYWDRFSIIFHGIFPENIACEIHKITLGNSIIQKM